VSKYAVSNSTDTELLQKRRSDFLRPRPQKKRLPLNKKKRPEE
jgi:hypothetical protein